MAKRDIKVGESRANPLSIVPGHDDNRIGPGGLGGLHRVTDQGFAVQCGEQLIGLPHALGTASGEDHGAKPGPVLAIAHLGDLREDRKRDFRWAAPADVEGRWGHGCVQVTPH